jgi:hypothetical protein
MQINNEAENSTQKEYVKKLIEKLNALIKKSKNGPYVRKLIGLIQDDCNPKLLTSVLLQCLNGILPNTLSDDNIGLVVPYLLEKFRAIDRNDKSFVDKTTAKKEALLNTLQADTFLKFQKIYNLFLKKYPKLYRKRIGCIIYAIFSGLNEDFTHPPLNSFLTRLALPYLRNEKWIHYLNTFAKQPIDSVKVEQLIIDLNYLASSFFKEEKDFFNIIEKLIDKPVNVSASGNKIKYCAQLTRILDSLKIEVSFDDLEKYISKLPEGWLNFKETMQVEHVKQISSLFEVKRSDLKHHSYPNFSYKYNKQVIICLDEDASDAKILRDKWTAHHSSDTCQVIRAEDFMQDKINNIAFSPEDVIRIYVIAHGEPGADFIGEYIKIHFETLAKKLTALIGNSKAVVNLISCGAASDSEYRNYDKYGYSFGAKLYKSLALEAKSNRDIPVVARVSMMSIDFDTGWKETSSLHTLWEDAEEAVDIHKQAYSKKIYIQGQYCDEYAYGWKNKVLEELNKSLETTQVDGVKALLQDWCHIFDTMDPKDILNILLSESKNPESKLKKYPSALEFFRPASIYNKILNLIDEGTPYVVNSEHRFLP